MQQRIGQIFADASSKLPTGETLGVNFNFTSAAQYTINVVPDKSHRSSPIMGNTHPGATSSDVYINGVAGPQSDASNFGRALGSVAAHEMGHGLGGYWPFLSSRLLFSPASGGDIAFDAKSENIMMMGPDNPNVFNSTVKGPLAAPQLTASTQFSAAQARALFDKCVSLQGSSSGGGRNMESTTIYVPIVIGFWRDWYGWGSEGGAYFNGILIWYSIPYNIKGGIK